MNNCDKYWGLAKYLPLEQVVTYWCQQSGHEDDHCKEGKKAATTQACEDGIISWRRSDGLSFKDPISSIAGRGLLEIERESFDKWVTENFADASPLPDKGLSTTERNTLLTIIAALCKHSRIDPKERGVPQRIMKMTDDLGAHVDDGTIIRHLKSIPDALESRMK